MTPDFTVRVQDGFLTFRWWRSYVPKDVSEDLSHSDTRVSIQLNGFELHIYNRTSTYKELEKKFGIFTGLFGNSDDENEISKGAFINDVDAIFIFEYFLTNFKRFLTNFIQF